MNIKVCTFSISPVNCTSVMSSSISMRSNSFLLRVEFENMSLQMLDSALQSDLVTLLFVKWSERPKSVSIKWPALSINIFERDKSPCTTFALWIFSIAVTISARINCVIVALGLSMFNLELRLPPFARSTSLNCTHEFNRIFTKFTYDKKEPLSFAECIMEPNWIWQRLNGFQRLLKWIQEQNLSSFWLNRFITRWIIYFTIATLFTSRSDVRKFLWKKISFWSAFGMFTAFKAYSSPRSDPSFFLATNTLPAPEEQTKIKTILKMKLIWIGCESNANEIEWLRCTT